MLAGRCTAAAATLLLAAGWVCAQENFPNRPVRIVVGFTAGSGTDFLARTVGQKLAESWNHPVVVDNRPGAGGAIAAELVARATPDGHTMMVVANGHAVNAAILGKLPYDTVRDFAGITYLADIPNVLVVPPALGLKSVRDLLDLAKSRPGRMNFGSAGIGSSTHLNAEVFKLATGVSAVHIPYKGSPELISNTIGGSVQFCFIPIPAVAALVKSGKITGLAVSTKSRSPVLPDTPSIAESGVAGFDFAGWYAVFAPAKTPHSIRNGLSKTIGNVLAMPDVKQRMLSQGATPKPSTPAALDAFLVEEIGRMHKVVKAAGIRVE